MPHAKPQSKKGQRKPLRLGDPSAALRTCFNLFGSGLSGIGCVRQIKEYLGLMTFETLFGGGARRRPLFVDSFGISAGWREIPLMA